MPTNGTSVILTPERLEKLVRVAKTMQEKRKGPIPILLLQFDPDAFGSALDTQDLLARHPDFRIPTIIRYVGEIDDPQNRLIMNFGGFRELVRPVEEGEDLGEVVLLDSSSTHDNRAKNQFIPKIVIDHHPGSDLQAEVDDAWFWCDPEAGSTVTMLVELMRAFNHDLGEDEGSKEIAAISFIGIQTDIGFPKRIGDIRNAKAMAWLLERTSKEAFDSFSDPKFEERFCSLHALATTPEEWDKIPGIEGLIVARTRMLKRTEVTYLSRFADFLLSCENATMVIVWALVENVGMVIKMRSREPKRWAPEMIRKISSSGGGRSHKGFGAAGAIEPWNTPPRKETEESATRFAREDLLIRIREAFSETVETGTD